MQSKSWSFEGVGRVCGEGSGGAAGKEYGESSTLALDAFDLDESAVVGYDVAANG